MTTPDSTPSETPEGGPKLHVDSDWKAQAQAEKERLAKKEEAREQSSRRLAPDELPPADFRSLVGILASQAVMALGGYTDPQSGRMVIDIVGGEFAINLLGVLESKTAGNLTDEEQKELGQVLSQLRARFLQIATMIAEQGGRQPGVGQQSASDPTAMSAEPAGGPKSKPIIEIP